MVLTQTAMRSAALRPVALRALSVSPVLSVAHAQSRFSSSIPTIAQPSFWKSLLPKAFRKDREAGAISAKKPKKTKSKEWNPATFFIVIFLFIGSMSIQMITLKKDFATFIRQSDVRIGLLREVVERIQRGEKVDVERMLGTDEPEKELEWEQVLKEIEKEDLAMKGSRRQEKKTTETATAKFEPTTTASDPAQPLVKSRGTASFY